MGVNRLASSILVGHQLGHTVLVGILLEFLYSQHVSENNLLTNYSFQSSSLSRGIKIAHWARIQIYTVC